MVEPIQKNMLFMDPVWDSFFVLYENGTVSDLHESNSCRVSVNGSCVSTFRLGSRVLQPETF